MTFWPSSDSAGFQEYGDQQLPRQQQQQQYIHSPIVFDHRRSCLTTLRLMSGYVSGIELLFRAVEFPRIADSGLSVSRHIFEQISHCVTSGSHLSSMLTTCLTMAASVRKMVHYNTHPSVQDTRFPRQSKLEQQHKTRLHMDPKRLNQRRWCCAACAPLLLPLQDLHLIPLRGAAPAAGVAAVQAAADKHTCCSPYLLHPPRKKPHTFSTQGETY